MTYSASGLPNGLTLNTSTGVITGTVTDDSEIKDHSVTITASDGNLTVNDTFVLTITNVNEAPVITGSASFSVSENQTSAFSVTATDADGNTLSYVLSGADASLFQVDTSGVVTFRTAPNFENPADSGEDNIYNVTVTVGDGQNPALTASQSYTVTVTDVNEAPVILGFTNVIVLENQIEVFTVQASDIDRDQLSYSLSGADTGSFQINSSGVVTFREAPSFNNPQDEDRDNIYDVNVIVSDGSLEAVKSYRILVVSISNSLFQETVKLGVSQSRVIDILERLINEGFSDKMTEELLRRSSRTDEGTVIVANELTPRSHTTYASAVEKVVTEVSRTILGRLSRSATKTVAPSGPNSTEVSIGEREKVWMEFVHSSGKRKDDNISLGYKYEGFSIRVGNEEKYRGGLLLGSALFYNASNLDDNSRTNSSINTVSLVAYGGFQRERNSILGSFTISYSNLDGVRTRNRSNLGNVFTDSDATTVVLDLNYVYSPKNLTYICGFRYSLVDMNDIEESGNLSINSVVSLYDTLRLKLGVVKRWSLRKGAIKDDVSVSFIYDYNILDIENGLRSQFSIGGDRFELISVNDERGTFTLSSDYKLQLKKLFWEFGVSYQFTSLSRGLNVSTKLKYSF